MFYVWVFCHTTDINTDSLIVSKQTWAYPRQHLQQLLWCVVSVRLNLPEVEEWKLCPLRYYANCVSTTLTVLILHNVESVYFFYSNPVFWNVWAVYCMPCNLNHLEICLLLDHISTDLLTFCGCLFSCITRTGHLLGVHRFSKHLGTV